MIEHFSIAQAFGLVSFILGLLTFYQKNDRKLKIVMLILQLNHVIHFILLGSQISAFSSLVSALRTGTAIYVSSKIVAVFFIVLGLVSGFFLADSVWDMLPILGITIGTYSIFLLKGIEMRVGLLIGATCWLANNILVGSIGGTLLEVSNIVVNGTTVLRLLNDKRKFVENSNQ